MELLLIYAVLARAKGELVTRSDVHDAWSAWMFKRREDHPSLVEYGLLPEPIQQEDEVFTAAIRKSARQLKLNASRPSFTEVLFPFGPPQDTAETQQALDLYKVMVQSSEGLVSRRQGVNTFFLTMNGALLTGAGLVLQNSGGNTIGALGIAVFSVTGAILCGAWRSLITSFGQLNRGKFQVINAIERHLRAAIYAAEWEALGRGEDPKIYRSFTSREIWVPNALLALHLLTLVTSVAVYTELVKLT
nr:hypothetical protein [Ramlibacter tataouinensis]